MRPLSVGRVESAFHPAIAHYGEVQTCCKENVTKTFFHNPRIRSGEAPAPGASVMRVNGRVLIQATAQGLLPCGEDAVEPAVRKYRVNAPMAWRTGQIEPLLPFPVGTRYGRNAPMSGPSRLKVASLMMASE
jgi:hypothetical protein